MHRENEVIGLLLATTTHNFSMCSASMAAAPMPNILRARDAGMHQHIHRCSRRQPALVRVGRNSLCRGAAPDHTRKAMRLHTAMRMPGGHTQQRGVSLQ